MTTTALLELTRAAAILNTAPYNTPPEKLAKAVALVRAGKVQRERTDRWLVASSSGEYWTVTRGVCDCPQHQYKTPCCKHVVAVKLATYVEQRLTALEPGRRPEAPAWSESQDAFLTEEEQMSTQTTPPSEPARLVFPGAGSRLPLRSIQAIIADLRRELPSACVAERKQGGQIIPLLHWWKVARILDTYAPGWLGEVRTLTMLGERCVVIFRLTIPCEEGEVWREDVGREEEDPAYGDPATNAKAAAFKRAAAQFGVGQWLYEKDRTTEAMAKHLKTEKAALLEELGKVLDARQLDRQAVIARLRALTGAMRNDEIPVSALKA